MDGFGLSNKFKEEASRQQKSEKHSSEDSRSFFHLNTTTIDDSDSSDIDCPLPKRQHINQDDAEKDHFDDDSEVDLFLSMLNRVQKILIDLSISKSINRSINRSIDRSINRFGY
jgi:hypothetical protein